jgi:hypothetical protein
MVQLVTSTIMTLATASVSMNEHYCMVIIVIVVISACFIIVSNLEYAKVTNLPTGSGRILQAGFDECSS